MRILRLGGAIAGIAGAAVFPAACALQPAAGVPQATQSAITKSTAPLASGGLIYAFGSFKHSNGAILDYPSGKFVSAFTTPRMGVGGVCSDTHGNVFAGGETISALPVIQKYSYGATSPTKTETFASNGGAIACTVDPGTGNVAAVVDFGSDSYTVVVLPHFTGRPKGYQDPSIPRLVSIGYDGGGNLFLLGTGTNHGSYALAELPKGGRSFKAISLNLGAHNGGVATVQWDGSHVTVQGAYDAGRGGKTWPGVVYELKISGAKATVLKTTLFKGFDDKSTFASNIAPALGVMAIAAGALYFWNYPSGGKLVAKIPTGVGSTYMATVAAVSSQ